MTPPTQEPNVAVVRPINGEPTNLEEWRPVVGYQGIYEVSSLGRVRRIFPYNNPRSNGVLKDQPTMYGYRAVNLCFKQRVKRMFVHRLVAQSFLSIEPEKTEVNHRDGTRTNNHVLNLEWVTPKENKLHSTRVLLRGIGMLQADAKLTDENIPNIFKDRSNGFSMRMLGVKYGVSKKAILLVLQRKTWRHVSI